MADGAVDVELKVKSSKAESEAQKAGNKIGKSVESGFKGAGKAAESTAKGIGKAFSSAGDSAKSAMSGVGSSAKSSFSDVGDAAKTASSDASSAFKNISADAAGSFSDLSSEAQSGLSGVVDAAEGAADGVDDAFEGAGETASGVFATKIPMAVAAATAAITAATAAVVGFIKESVSVGANFDKAMSQVAATMGVTTDEVQELRDFAQEMGAKTAFSATQAAEALNYMALAGYDAKTSMDMLPVVLNLAAAGNFDLARASDMVTDAQSALGLSLDQTVDMVDQMAMASSKTNTSVEQLGDAFLTVGGTARNLKGGTAELAQMLGILADNGIKGSEGGTALRNVILSLSAPTDKAADKIEELGLSVFDAEGNMRSMPDIVNDLNAAMDGLTQQEKTEALNTIFNKVDLKSVNALLGTSATRFDEVAASISNAQGSAQKMADTQLDNLAGDVTLLQSATEGLAIQVSDKLSPTLRSLTQFATNAIVPAFSNIVSHFGEIAGAIAKVAAAFGIFKASQKVMAAFKASTQTAATTVSIFGKEMKLTGVAAKVATVGMRAASTAARALGTAFKTIAPMAALTVAVEAFSKLAEVMGEAKERADTLHKATTNIGNGLSSYKSSFESAFGSTGKTLREAGDSARTYEGGLADLNSRIQDAITHQAELGDKLSETWGNAGTNNAMVQQYADTIRELAGNTAGSAEKQAQLQLAVDGLNSIMGTSYSIVDQQNGVLSENVDMILASANAWQQRALAEAASASYEDLMKQKIENASALAAADEKVKDAQEKLNSAANDFESAMYAQQLRDAQSEADNLRSADNALNEEMARTQQVVSELSGVYGSSTDSLSGFVNGIDGFVGSLQASEVDTEAFIQTLSNIGVSVDDLSSIVQTQGQAGIDGLVAAFQGGSDSLMAWVSENIPRIAESYTGAMEENSAVMQESTQAAMDAQTETINAASETTNQAAADNANATADAYISTMDGRQGDVSAATDNLVTGGMSGAEGAADTAGQGIGAAGAGGIASGFGTASGQISQTVQLTMTNAAASAQGNSGAFHEAGAQAGGEYAAGVGEGAGGASEAGAQIASSATDGMSQGVNEASQVGNSTSESYIGEIARADARPAAAQMKDGAIAELKKGEAEATTAGQMLGQGFINGMGSTMSSVIQKAAELARAAVDAIKKEGQQGSPWKTTIRAGKFAGEGLGVGVRAMTDYVVDSFKAVTRAGIDAMGTERKLESGIVWEQSGRFGGKMIAKGIMIGFEAENPLSQMQQSIQSGMSAINVMAASGGGDVYNSDYRQTLNFNQPIKSPDEVARQMRLQQHYGLAGRY